MAEKLPNFLIVGAAKSGTTSLYYYLKQHPEVYMSPVKEPRFLSGQFRFKRGGYKKYRGSDITTFDKYKGLFKKVKSEKAIGEVSPDNLYFYEDAIKNIKSFLGDVKIIIILRNPVERAFSHYLMLIKDSMEYLAFDDALKAEEERKVKNWAADWHYKSIGLYYSQVKAYLDKFSRVKVYLFDELKENSLALMKDIYEFLGVDSSFIPDITIRHNISGIPKNRFLYSILIRFNPFKLMLKPIINRSVLIENKVLHLWQNLKRTVLEKPQMKPRTRQYLKELFYEDILKLQELIGRDLGIWLK